MNAIFTAFILLLFNLSKSQNCCDKIQIKVIGNGEIKIFTDIAYVDILVEVQKDTTRSTLFLLNEKLLKLMDLFAAHGIL